MDLSEVKNLVLELIVVFLGVTAGFLLNNWQMDRADHDLEAKYVEGFLHDVGENISSLEEAVSADSTWLSAMLPQLVRIREGKLEADSASGVVKRIVNVSKLEAENTTYEEIINSGKLNIINDLPLRKAIVDYYGTMDGVGFIDDYFYSYFSDFVMPFVFQHFNVLEGTLSDTRVMATVQFPNVIAGYVSVVQQRQTAYAGLLTKAKSLRAQLSAYKSDHL